MTTEQKIIRAKIGLLEALPARRTAHRSSGRAQNGEPLGSRVDRSRKARHPTMSRSPKRTHISGRAKLNSQTLVVINDFYLA